MCGPFAVSPALSDFLAPFTYVGTSGITEALSQVLACFPGKITVRRPNPVELLLLQIFQIEQGVVRAFGDANEFVQLDLERLGVAILGVLDQEDHEKRDDRGAGIDYELPGIAEMKQWTCQQTSRDRGASRHKRKRAAGDQ